MPELNDLFDYGLKIYQDPRYFKFSIDSILLGEFVKLKKGDRILDLCTGNVPIPLILTTRMDEIHIDAVEVQDEIYRLANLSINANGLQNKIDLIHGDAKTLKYDQKYDTIVCNPPYFKVTETSQINDEKVKRTARHEVLLTLEDVIRTAKDNLKENGTLYLVHRVERFLETIRLLEDNKFGIRTTIFVTTKQNRNAEFFLIEASKCKKSDLKVKSVCIENLKTYKNIFKED